MKNHLLIFLALFLTNSAYAKVYKFKYLEKQACYDKDVESVKQFGSEDEYFALNAYTFKTDTFYKDINGYLRDPNFEMFSFDKTSVSLLIRDLDQLIEKAPKLPGDIILFRGLTLKYRDNKSFDEGEEFTDKAYTSTTTKFSVATDFAEPQEEYNEWGEVIENNSFVRSAIFEMYSEEPKMTGILIGEWNEDEVLLPRGLTFRIMKKGTYKQNDFYLVQICSTKTSCKTDITHPDALKVWNSFK